MTFLHFFLRDWNCRLALEYGNFLRGGKSERQGKAYRENQIVPKHLGEFPFLLTKAKSILRFEAEMPVDAWRGIELSLLYLYPLLAGSLRTFWVFGCAPKGLRGKIRPNS